MIDFLNNQYVTAVLTLFLILYSSLARPQLPLFVAELFNYTAFRLVILFLVVYLIGKQNTQVALLVAVAFSVTMLLISEQKIAEGFIDQSKEYYDNDDTIESTVNEGA